MRILAPPLQPDTALNLWLSQIAQGFRGGISPVNIHETAKRHHVVVTFSGLNGSEIAYPFYARHPVKIEEAWIISSVSTSGSTLSSHWKFHLRTAAGKDLNGSGVITAGGEIVADIPWSCLPAGVSLVRGDTVKLSVTKVGAPTSLSSAAISLVLILIMEE